MRYHSLVATALLGMARTDGAPPSVHAPSGAPNVLVVLLDDQGYGQSSTFGGLVPTPTLDRLAASGLRYSRFHVTAMCSPTRAALLTGRNHHAVGMGIISNLATDEPGYNSVIPKSAAMVSEILRENGYATAAFGKWHLIPEPECTPAGPFDHWPTGQGFEHYYGFLNGETDQWHPALVLGTQPVTIQPPPGRTNDYTLNEDLADHAITWIRAHQSLAPDRPFFVYYAPGASHAPLQAPKAWIDRFRGQFDMGWDRYREIVLKRQIALGVVPPGTQLTPRPASIPAWDDLSPGQKKVAARLMEVFAGFTAQSDHELGRVIDAITDTGQLDNTLILYIAGDNGASLEGGLYGATDLMIRVNGLDETTDEMLAKLDDLGGPTTEPHYPVGWAWAGNTPFQWGKRYASHLGGTRDPLVISWPRRIKDPGATRYQFEHVIDIAPTILEAAGIPEPEVVNGVRQQRLDGMSFLATIDSPTAPSRRTTQYFELLGNRAIYHDEWMAAALSGQSAWAPAEGDLPLQETWELYDLGHDYSEASNLAARYPEKVNELRSLFDKEAKQNQVYPINPSWGRQARPTGTHFTYYGRTGHLFLCTTPAYENRSYTITAHVQVPTAGANGVLVADGGSGGGFSLFLKDGKPTYVYNFFRKEITTLSAPQSLLPGRATIVLHSEYAGGGRGKPADVTLLVNGREVARARLPHTVPFAFAFDDTFDVGEDSASPVGDYQAPFPFTGAIERIDLELAARN